MTVVPSPPPQPPPRRTATYTAILCALSLAGGEVVATEVVDLANLGAGGFRIDGVEEDDKSGTSVSGAGDVNGDGLADLIVGAAQSDPEGLSNAGTAYVVFGKADNASVDLATLNTLFGCYSCGFLIVGAESRAFLGNSVSSAGDVNGDGLDDLIIGAYEADPGGNDRAGKSYVVFGKTDTSNVNLNSLGEGGFQIDGIGLNDFSGVSVSGAGDVNGDGLDDLIIGADRADPDGNESAGESYVVFGKADSTRVDLASLDNGGFRIDGINPDDRSGSSVSVAGDVNGDGLNDLIIGAPQADPDGKDDAGQAYVVFGKADNGSVDLANLGGGGFQIDGLEPGDRLGRSVSDAGDVNGDGLADLIIGAPGADESYVVFGKAGATTVDLADLDNDGFQIGGVADFYGGSGLFGSSVSGAGDVNGDGLDDLIIGAPLFFKDALGPAGRSYVVFGKADSANVEINSLGNGGFGIDGINSGDESGLSVSGAGDVNGDGLDDLIIGAPEADPGEELNEERNAGESYVVFGPRPIAGPLFFTDRDRFLTATQAFQRSRDYIVTNSPFPSEVESGDIVFTAPSGSSLFFNNWAADFPEDNDVELTLNGTENLDIALSDEYVSENSGETYAMGIDFNDALGGTTPSTFEVTVFIGDNRLASFRFDTEQLPDQNYIGVWSQVPFNRLEIRETPTANENEFFGTVSAGRRPLPNQIFADRFEFSPPLVE